MTWDTWDGPDIDLRFTQFQDFEFGIDVGFRFHS